MIPKAELLALRGEWSLSDEVIEKDYVLGWLLAGIAADPVLREQWVFKGGTALRKCGWSSMGRRSNDARIAEATRRPSAGWHTAARGSRPAYPR